jgi:hypothetical protein
MWLSVLAEHGVVAFALWIVLLAACLLTLRSIRLTAKGGTSGLRHGGEWSRMLEGSLVGYIVAGTFLDFAYFELYYELIAVIVVLAGLGLPRGRTERARQPSGGAPRSIPVSGLGAR